MVQAKRIATFLLCVFAVALCRGQEAGKEPVIAKDESFDIDAFRELEQDGVKKGEDAKAAAAPVNKIALVPVEDPRIQQYIQILQPVMWKELNFIRQVCDLTPEQRPKIRAAADIAVKEGAQAILKHERAGTQPAIGREAIREKLHEALRKSLTKEQLERFGAEQGKRGEAKRQATILAVVAELDGALFLSREQREKIAAALEKHWQRDWEQWVSIAQYGGQYLPQIPDQHVAPVLNEEQKLVWSSVQKISMNSWDEEDAGQNEKEEAWWRPQGAKAPKAKAAANGKAALLRPPKKE